MEKNSRRARLKAFRRFTTNVWHSFLRKRCQGLASEIGFWSFYSIFPLITFVVAISSFFPFAENPDKVLNAANKLLPFNVQEVVGPVVTRILSQPNYLLAGATLLLAMWAASRAVSSLTAALNDIYGVVETRPYWKRKVIALLMVAILTLIYILAFMFLVVGPIILNFLSENIAHVHSYWPLIKALRLGIIMVALFIGFLVMYALGPNMRRNGKKIVPGALVSSIGWFVVSWAFGYYISNIARVGRIYGPLGAVIVMLTWLYLISLIILVGALVNREMMNRA